MKRTQSQNKRLYGLFGRLGIDEDTKRAMVSAITRGRTEHTSELTVEEANELISALTDELRRAKKQQYEESNRLRRKVFQYFYELGWIDVEMSNTQKRNIIANWIIQRTKTGKNDINQLTTDELNTVIRQLKAIKRNYEERQKEEKKSKIIHVNGAFQLLPNGMQICLN